MIKKKKLSKSVCNLKIFRFNCLLERVKTIFPFFLSHWRLRSLWFVYKVNSLNWDVIFMRCFCWLNIYSWFPICPLKPVETSSDTCVYTHIVDVHWCMCMCKLYTSDPRSHSRSQLVSVPCLDQLSETACPYPPPSYRHDFTWLDDAVACPSPLRLRFAHPEGWFYKCRDIRAAELFVDHTFLVMLIYGYWVLTGSQWYFVWQCPKIKSPPQPLPLLIVITLGIDGLKIHHNACIYFQNGP